MTESSFIVFFESDERPMNPRYSKEYRKRVHRFSLIFNENPPVRGGGTDKEPSGSAPLCYASVFIDP